MDPDDRDTLHSCEACDGEGCSWCHNGLQSRTQYARWAAFRQKMQHISNTYTFLEAIMIDILDRLDADGSALAKVLVTEGQELLGRWQSADPTKGGRTEATENLRGFSKRALDYLQAP